MTLHSRRVRFTERLAARMPELEVFGHGVKAMSDEAEALDAFRYHIAVENYVYPHHLTEKLPDAFLGYTLPFYHGCPNTADYFPRDSFIPIDIEKFESALDIIQSTLANQEYQDRLPFIIEDKRRVLEEHILFGVLERTIRRRTCETRSSRSFPAPQPTAGELIMNLGV